MITALILIGLGWLVGGPLAALLLSLTIRHADRQLERQTAAVDRQDAAEMITEREPVVTG